VKIRKVIEFAIVVILVITVCLVLSSYNIVRRFHRFHHLEYNGDAYYILADSSAIPEEFIAFGDDVVSVILVDRNGEPYDEDRSEEARTYQNDTERLFLFYQSDPYTKDLSLVDGNILN